MVIKTSLRFDPAGEDRTLHIYLPDQPPENGERYPVMYMFDGHNLFSDADATYGKAWGMTDFLDSWDVKRMMVVGVECSHHGTERLNEYSPYELSRPVDFNGAPLPVICGRGEETMQWMRMRLKPFIDSNFPAFGYREGTAIGGSSMGGLMALYAVIAHNDVYSKAACLSPSVMLCMRQLKRELDRHPLNPDTRVYLSWGELEEKNGLGKDRYRRHILQLHDGLQQQGVQVQRYCQSGGGHCEADWEKQIPRFMEWLWL